MKHSVERKVHSPSMILFHILICGVLNMVDTVDAVCITGPPGPAGSSGNLVVQENHKVAFCARLASDIDLSLDEPVPFGYELVDIGNDFLNGNFTAPIAGYYRFEANIGLMPNDFASLVLKVASISGSTRSVIRICDELGGSDRYDQVSNSAIVHMEEGDQVAIFSLGNSNIRGGQYSSFLGYLLWADDA